MKESVSLQVDQKSLGGWRQKPAVSKKLFLMVQLYRDRSREWSMGSEIGPLQMRRAMENVLSHLS